MHSPPGVSKEDNMEQKQIIAVAIVAILVISAGVAAVLIMGGAVTMQVRPSTPSPTT